MDLENELKVTKEIKVLIELFSKYQEQKGWKPTKQPTIFLRRLNLFFQEKQKEREKIMKKTKLHGSDCLTQSTITKIIGKHFGFSFGIAIPKNPKKLFHTMVSYKDREGKTKFYNISGKAIYRKGNNISQKQVIRRIKITKPVVKVANKFRHFKV